MGLLLNFNGSGVPTGACPTGLVTYTDLATGLIYNCVSGAWQQDTTHTASIVPGTPSMIAGATTGVIPVSMTATVITITPTGACTFNATGGITGQETTFVVTTLGTTSFVLTFGTNFRSVGTLATGIVTAKLFTVTFRNTNGTQWVEIGRTTAQ